MSLASSRIPWAFSHGMEKNKTARALEASELTALLPMSLAKTRHKTTPDSKTLHFLMRRATQSHCKGCGSGMGKICCHVCNLFYHMVNENKNNVDVFLMCNVNIGHIGVYI